MSIPRVHVLNRVASKLVDFLEHNVLWHLRCEQLYELVANFAHKVDRLYSEGNVLCDECCKVASYVRQKQHLDLKTYNVLFDVVADVLWYLGVSSRRCSYKAARTIVYDMTYTNWSKLNRPEGYFNDVTAESLYNNLTSDLTYFSDRWSFDRLLRFAYRFGNVLIQENVDVYDLCFNGRFHRESY